MKRALLLILALAPAAACASAQAKAPAERPNLEVPPAPPRIIEPTPVEPPAAEPVENLPPVTPTRSKPPASSSSRDREPAKPEPKPEPPVEPPPATPPAPAPQLRTSTSPDGPTAARQIRESLDRASKMLNSIDYRALSPERRNSYDSAKKFMKEGDEALKASNYVLAKELADKAERYAKELQGR